MPDINALGKENPSCPRHVGEKGQGEQGGGRECLFSAKKKDRYSYRGRKFNDQGGGGWGTGEKKKKHPS